jgi:hypothetical protein
MRESMTRGSFTKLAGEFAVPVAAVTGWALAAALAFAALARPPVLSSAERLPVIYGHEVVVSAPVKPCDDKLAAK